MLNSLESYTELSFAEKLEFGNSLLEMEISKTEDSKLLTQLALLVFSNGFSKETIALFNRLQARLEAKSIDWRRLQYAQKMALLNYATGSNYSFTNKLKTEVIDNELQKFFG